MATTRVAERLLRKLAPQVADYWGNKTSAEFGGTSVVLDRQQGSYAYSNKGSGQVAIDPTWLAGATRGDVRGMLVHELTHMYGVGDGKSSKRVENLADSARANLNSRYETGWTPNAQAARIAERRNMAGPGSNEMGTRQRNTLTNLRSKRPMSGGQPVPTDPGTYGGAAAQIMGLQQQLAAAQALAKTQVGNARADMRNVRIAAGQQRIADTAGAEEAATAAGIVGSSSDLQGRAAAITTQQQTIQEGLAQRQQAIAAARLGQVTAIGNYYTGVGQVQAEVANQEYMHNIQRYQNDLLATQTSNFNDLRAAILRRLANRGRARDQATPYTRAPGQRLQTPRDVQDPYWYMS